MSSNSTVTKSIWNIDIGVYGFLMNPNNAVLVIAIASLVIGIAMDHLVTGIIISSGMFALYFFNWLQSQAQSWPPSKTLCPDYYYVKNMTTDNSGNVASVTCAPAQDTTEMNLGTDSAQNSNFEQQGAADPKDTFKNACEAARQAGLTWESCVTTA